MSRRLPAISSRPSLTRPRPLILAAALLVLVAGEAPAHLSIIRQGYETGGGNHPGDEFGRALAVGDFNGDGLDDLAMGAPKEDVGSLLDVGSISINYGSMHGLTHVGSIAYVATDMTGSLVAGAHLGWSLVAADFNTDGYDDLAIGAPQEDIGSAIRAGSVYLMRGSSAGLQPWTYLTQDDFSFGVEAGDQFGWSLAAGDLNGDGRPDLVIGSPGEDASEGAVFYALATDAGLYGTHGVLYSQNLPLALQRGDALGASVAVGNVMGGSEDDIVIGVPFKSGAAGGAFHGEIVVVPGSSTVPQSNFAEVYAAPDGPQINATFGWSLATGKLVAGVYDAVAVGEPGRDVHPEADAGRVMILPGSVDGLVPSGAIEVLNSDAGGFLDEGDFFGHAVAVGRFWDPADGYDDLAVGTPDEGFGTGQDYGQVQILIGGPFGPTGAYGWFGFNQGTLNDAPEPNDALGRAVAFGRFDNTGFGNLAVGATGEDALAGMVHVIAPWRQAYGLSCKRSVVLDCDENFYFTQKPFDQVSIASTTKIMTCFLALRAAHVYQDVNLDYVYTVPRWVAEDIPGSQVPLFENEEITFEDLIYSCLLRSGNDAAFAIADIMFGETGPDDAVVTFVNLMNAQAEIIGMTNTHFHNPAGLDHEPVGPEMGEHYSTPEDMAILSAFVMEDIFFRELAGTMVWPMVRHFPEFDISWQCFNIFNGVMGNNIEPLTGIKGGWTPNAETTGCFAADAPAGGRSIATTFGTSIPTNYGPDAGRLVQLGMASCGYFFSLPDDWDYGNPFGMAGVRSGFGDRHGASAAIPRHWEGNMEYTATRTTWESGEPASFEMRVTHLAELRGQPEYDLGARVIDGHGPMRITNVGEQVATVSVYLPYQFFEFPLVEPGESVEIPARDGAWLGFPVRFATFGGNNLTLDVELPYEHIVEAPGDFEPGPAYSTLILRGTGISQDGIEIRTEGLDAGTPGEFYVTGQEPGTVVSTPEEPQLVPSDAPLVQLRAPYPNPFRTDTRIGFDLARSGEVGVEIYDVTGRLVREYLPRAMPPGGWGVRWDGRSESGVAAADGIYLYHVTVDGEVRATGKVTLIR